MQHRLRGKAPKWCLSLLVFKNSSKIRNTPSAHHQSYLRYFSPQFLRNLGHFTGTSGRKGWSAIKVSPFAFGAQANVPQISSILLSMWRGLRWIMSNHDAFDAAPLRWQWFLAWLVPPVRAYYDKPSIVKVDEPPSHFRTRSRPTLTADMPWKSDLHNLRNANLSTIGTLPPQT